MVAFPPAPAMHVRPRHACEPVWLYYPGAQPEQVELPADPAYVWAAHCTQADMPPTPACAPAAQSTGAVCPAVAQYWPSGHGRHTEAFPAAAVAEYVPARQPVQLSADTAPEPSWYVPATHASQLVQPAVSW